MTNILSISRPALTWNELVQLNNSSEWLISFREMLVASSPGTGAVEDNSEQQIFASFVGGNGFRYLPVLGRIDRSRGWPLFASVHLVRQTVLADAANEMQYRGVPPAYTTIVLLLRMARVFRWSFMEPLIRSLKQFQRAIGDSKTVLGSDQTGGYEIHAQYLTILRWKEIDRGLIDPDFTANAISADDEQPYNRIWREYGASRKAFAQALRIW